MGTSMHGHGARQGVTAFAFCVLRFRDSVDRDGLLEVLRYVAPLIPDADRFIEDLPEDSEWPLSIVALPWSPPESGHPVEAQRRLIQTAGTVGVERAWFFQVGTSLGEERDDEDDDEDDEDDENDEGDELGTETFGALPAKQETMDDAWVTDVAWGEISVDTKPVTLTDTKSLDPTLDNPDVSSEAEPEDHGPWTHGAPPAVERARFPVDGHPAILDELDWEDFGIVFKLAGAWQSGARGVLGCFHALWLAPYSGRFRNTAVTIDRAHNAAHLWVDRFAVPTESAQQVGHLLWVLSKIDEVFPIVHARFEGASMARKYSGLMGDTSEPFVLGGNPLFALYTDAGDAAVDEWIAAASQWSKEEIAAMLREIAIEVVTTGREQAPEPEPEADEEENAGEEVDAMFEDEAVEEAEDDDVDEEEDEEDEDEEDEEDEEEDDDPEEHPQEDDGERPGRVISAYAGEILAARASAGQLDVKAAPQLVPVLAQVEKYEHRRSAVVDILGALRFRPAVPALIQILETTTIKDSLDSIGKEHLRARTAHALGAIADPAAIPALARLVAAAGRHNDKPRATAAEALAACLAAMPEPREIDDRVLGALLDAIRQDAGEVGDDAHIAYGKITRQLGDERRADAARRLADTQPAGNDLTAILARAAGLALASGEPPIPELRGLLHGCLTSFDYDHLTTVRNVRLALRVAEILPQLVDPTDVVWLTRFAEPDVRARAHALLATVGHAQPPAAIHDSTTVRSLDEVELCRLISEPHVVGRAALIAEAARRKLAAAARPARIACEQVISRAREGDEDLLAQDTATLSTAVQLLRVPPLDPETIALFERMLQHSNHHIRWELLRDPVDDERLRSAYDSALAHADDRDLN